MSRPWIEKNKKTGFYYVRWRDGKKKPYEVCGQDYQNALDVRDTIEKRLLSHEHGFLDRERTFDSLKREYLKNCPTNRPKTIKGKEYALGLFSLKMGDCELVKITVNDMQGFRRELLIKHKVNGVNIIMNPISSCFNYGVKMGYLKSNPARGMQLEAEKVWRFLDRKEIGQLLRACRHHRELARIVRIALYTGLRQGNILGLPRERIADGYIYVATKNKRDDPSTVPINPKIKRALRMVDFKAWSKNRLTRAFGRAVKRAKLGRVRFHDLRHTFCSTYLQSGGTIADLRMITGHKSLKSLQKYAHFQNNYLKERIQAFKFSRAV